MARSSLRGPRSTGALRLWPAGPASMIEDLQTLSTRGPETILSDVL